MTLQKERVKSLEEILRESPAAQAYAREMRERRKPDPLPDFDAPPCPNCGGLGWMTYDVRYDHPLFAKPFPCPNPECATLKALRAERYAKLCTLAQIPKDYQDMTFALWRDLFETAPEFQAGKLDAFGAALAFVEARERGFRFTLDEAAAAVGIAGSAYDSDAKCSMVYRGDTGVGKTSLGVCIARELIDVYQVQVVYLLMGEFFMALQERFSKKQTYEYGGDADDTAELMRFYQRAPVLILDEFPLKPGKTNWWEQQVYELINYRQINQMPTVITTNFDQKTLMDEWGAMIGSRLQTMAHWFHVGGKEVRRRDAEVVSR